MLRPTGKRSHSKEDKGRSRERSHQVKGHRRGEGARPPSLPPGLASRDHNPRHAELHRYPGEGSRHQDSRHVEIMESGRYPDGGRDGGGQHPDAPRSMELDRHGDLERFRFEREQARRDRSDNFLAIVLKL